MIDFCLYDSLSMIDVLIEKFEEGASENGYPETLQDGDERVIILNVMNYLAECIFNKINAQANNNLVLFCDEANLIYKGIERNVYRIPAQYAVCKVRFSISSIAPSAVIIPAGTKVTADGDVFFETDVEVEIEPGEFADIPCTSTEAEAKANGYAPGSITTLATTLPYIKSVSNIDTSSKGGDEESIESFRRRVLFAPISYNSTGTEAAYREKTYEVSSRIADVAVDHNDNDVFVYILCNEGQLPTEDLIDITTEYLNKDTIKAITDNITVRAASQVQYSINMKYKILKADQTRATEIQASVDKAVDDYIKEIGLAMGNPINPEMLRKAAYVAGAASCEIISPDFEELKPYEVAVCTSKNVAYDGLL